MADDYHIYRVVQTVENIGQQQRSNKTQQQARNTPRGKIHTDSCLRLQ
jgi:hypothetical protein